MKILVTGGAGFIGSHLVDRLLSQKREVIVVDNLSTGRRENLNSQAKLIEADIADYEHVSRICAEEKPEGVFHLAALPRVPVSINDPSGTTKTNILGTVNMFKAAADAGAKRVVFASSSSAYGNQDRLPLQESMIPSPVSPYALQKLTGERFAAMFSRLYGVPIVSLRFFNVYGPRIALNSGYSLVLGKFLKQQKEGSPLTIFGNGEQSRAFCYIDDVVEATLRAMESPKIQGGEVINVGCDKAETVNYLASLIGGEKQYLPPREGDVLHTLADITRAKELLDWEPKVYLEDGVRRTVEWFQKQEVQV